MGTADPIIFLSQGMINTVKRLMAVMAGTVAAAVAHEATLSCFSFALVVWERRRKRKVMRKAATGTERRASVEG